MDPQLPIVDAHQHLFDNRASDGRPGRRYLMPDFLSDVAKSGHNVTHSVYVQSGNRPMYRADGPEEMKAVGETEFANGVAAMAASGQYGSCRVAAGIVAAADLRRGDAVKSLLEAHVAAGNGRTRGVRFSNVWADVPIFGGPPATDPARKLILRDPRVREGVAHLEPLGLSLDSWCFHPELGELAALASAFPNTTIILNHLGTPLNTGKYAAMRDEIFVEWKKGIEDIAKRPNVFVKLGGLGMVFDAPVGDSTRGEKSVDLAPRWKPYIETTIAAFGPDRCMFESNFPPDYATCTYGAMWNTFKRITAGYSDTEKSALFSRTAKRAYRL